MGLMERDPGWWQAAAGAEEVGGGRRLGGVWSNLLTRNWGELSGCVCDTTGRSIGWRGPLEAWRELSTKVSLCALGWCHCTRRACAGGEGLCSVLVSRRGLR